MTISVTLQTGSSVNYLDTTENAMSLALPNGGPRPNHPTHIILVRGANQATLSSAPSSINFNTSTHPGVNTITWAEVGDSLTLLWEGTSKKWSIISHYGVTFS